MRPVSIDKNIAHVDNVEAWRRQELCELFPEMPRDQVHELAGNANRTLLQQARRLAADGCPAALAYRILR